MDALSDPEALPNRVDKATIRASALTLSDSNPLRAVFLRRLAWECYVAKKKLPVKAVVEDHVQAARKDLGLAPHGDRSHNGAADAFIQKLREDGLLSEKYSPPEPKNPGWEREWRVLYLPPHQLVRQLSVDPVFDDPKGQNPTGRSYKEILVTLRDPAIPKLRVFVGPGTTVGTAGRNRRGVYFLREDKGLYIGKSDEIDVRLKGHQRTRNPAWCAFLAIEEDDRTFTLDALEAAEALLISFWNEIAVVTNDKRGSDRKPAFLYLQQAILLAEGASATLLWLVHNQATLGLTSIMDADQSLDIPFKKCGLRTWPECYMTIPE